MNNVIRLDVLSAMKSEPQYYKVKEFFSFFKAVGAPARWSIDINCLQATVSALPSLPPSLRKELWSKHASVHAGGVMVPDPQSLNHPPELIQEANGQKPHPTYLFTDCFRPEVLKVCDWSQL